MNDVGALHQGYRAAWSVTVDAGRELEECVSERLRRLLCDEVPDAVDVDRGDVLADLAQRHLIDENLVALSIAGWEFDQILDITQECYFHSPVFKKIRLRIHKDDAVPEKKYTSLA